jgi:hypothetical protein
VARRTLRNQLDPEAPSPWQEWAAARSGAIMRERTALLARMSTLDSGIGETEDVEHLRGDLKRLLTDVHRHLQRLSDLAYDDVELELGGSE